MLFQKISSAFLSVTVMLSSLTINGLAADTEMNTAPSQEVISFPAYNDSAEYILDLAEDTVDLTEDMEGSIAVGAFTVTGGVLDTDFSYSGGVLTVLTEVPLTISNTETSAVTDTIAIAKDVSANITLSGVSINASKIDGACAFEITADSAGDVNITLSGTNILKSGDNCAGLQKNGANGSLTITGSGSLTAAGGSYGAGIGGVRSGNVNNITISGGTVTATGGTYGAAIGGCYGDVTGITISGGNVTANGGEYGGAGIGGGRSGNIKDITISGGTVTSTGSIGDSATTIIISGGSVKASSIKTTPTNGVKNVYPMVIDNPDGGEILIDGVPFTPTSHGDEAKVYAYLTGESHTVTVSGTSTDYYFNTPEELFYEGTSMDNYLDFTITGGTYGIDYIYCSDVITVLTDTPLTFSNKSEEATTQGIAVAKDVSANITLSGVNINASLCAFRIADDSTGDVNITLEGRNILKSNIGNAGLQKNGEYGSLTIGGTGSLTAKGGLSGAGIGSYGSSASNITIIGGTVTAIGNSGAGIGGGYDGSASNITISGGTVTATGVSGAGIGGGIGASASNITISGGKVTATGDTGAGIGGGSGASASNITISGGTVTATGDTGAGIGGGSRASASNITISGGTVKASSTSITPTNGTENVYAMVIENPTGRAILIDGTPFTPVVHGSEARAYAYVTGESHTVTVNGTPTNYCFNPLDNQFYKGETVEDCIEFTINGGTYGDDYEFANGTVTILSEKPLTISNKTAAATEQKLAVAKDISANITISGVNIDVSSKSGACAFGIADNSAGNVNITLEGTNILKSGNECAGLQKNGTNGSLTIGGTGALTAVGGPANYNGPGGAGIGSGARYDTSNITINGGDITANGGKYGGAGIGGGYEGSASDITINGGNITAAGDSADSLGGGMYSGVSNVITISGGTVSGTGSIGSGASKVTISGGTVTGTGNIGSDASNVTINSGIVTVSGGIGSSAANVKIIDGEINAGSIGSGAANINISGGTVTSSFIGGSSSNIIISGGSVKASVKATPTNGVDYVYSLAIGNPDGEEILIDGKPFTHVSHGSEAKVYAYVTGENHTITVNGVSANYCFHYLDKWFYKADSVEEYLDFTITGGTYGVDYDVEYGDLIIYTDKPLTISNKTDALTNQGIAITKDVSADITLSGVNIGTSGCAFMIADDSSGDVNITLLGKNTLDSGSDFAGLQKNGTNGSLTISGTGSLIAIGGDYGAGIGGGSGGSASSITINGGDITAVSYANGAGIGGGSGGSASNITINDGNITAYGGMNGVGYGAGIGGGYGGSASYITINGGDITAVGYANSAGIGGSDGGSASYITINGGNVTANGGSGSYYYSGGAGIGGGDGDYSTCSSHITITGGTVTATGGSGGAGIGSGNSGYNISITDITISGGTVIATGGKGGAGIGGGSTGSAQNITISGGVVTATGSAGAAGIGGGQNGCGSDIEISGGTVTATGRANGAGIGSGQYQNASDIIISGGSVKAVGENSNDIGGGQSYKPVVPTNGTENVYLLAIDNPTGGEILIDGKAFTPTSHGDEARVYAYLTGENHTISINGRVKRYCFDISEHTFYLDESSEDNLDFTITGGTYNTDYSYADNVITVLTDTPLTFSNKTADVSSQGIAVAKDVNANITLCGVKIDVSSAKNACAFRIADDSTGNVDITLVGTNILNSGENCAGLQKNGKYGSLIICGSGSLTVTGGTYGAGIGGGNKGSATDITISGGVITATGGSDCAGIGGGYQGSVSDIIISGGSVKASSIGAEPTNGADTAENVYLLVVENPDKETIIIDGKEFTPITHNDENRVYLYLTGKEHTVQTCITIKRFRFVDGTFAELIPAEVFGHGLTISNLGVEFYMSLGDSIKADENAYMLFTLPSGKTQQIYVKDAGSKFIDDVKCYVFPCYVAAAEISDVISAQIVTGDGETSDTYTYSLAEQCADVVNSDGSESEIALAKAILNYGTQAQLFFDHNTENPANASLAENDRELAAISAYTLRTYRYTVVDNDDEIDFIGQLVQLNDNVAVKFYFSGNIDVSTCRVNGKRISSADIGKDTNGSYIIIRDILPEDLDEAYTITAGDVTVSNASVFSYIYIAIQAQRTDLYHIVYALYAYNKAAEAYFA